MKMRLCLLIGVAALVGLWLLMVPASLQGENTDAGGVLYIPAQSAQAAPPSEAMENLSRMPLAFTENRGQWDERVRFRASAGGATMWFCRDGITYQFTHRVARQTSGAPPARVGSATVGQEPAVAGAPDMLARGHDADSIESVVVHAAFAGADPNLELVGEPQLEYRCNYFLGNDPAKWRTDVPNYAAVVYRGVYPGVDLRYEGGSGVLTCSQKAATESDPSQVKFRYDGNATVTETSPGQFRVEAPWGTVFEPSQSLPSGGHAGTAEPAAALKGSESTPVELAYSTFLGGSSDDYGRDITVDANGSAYVTGYTWSSDFPTENAYDSSHSGIVFDVFVAKLTPGGDALVYCTYLGGTSDDRGFGIAVDPSGSASVTGITCSNDFPTQNAYDGSYNNGEWDVFVTKLAAAGNALVYSTFLGGSGDDEGMDIVVGTSGEAFVVGTTASSDFPTEYAVDPTYNGSYDVFVTKLAPDGGALVYSTFLGRAAWDLGYGIAVDNGGAAYVTGATESSTFPTKYPYDGTLNGPWDAFVTKLNPWGGALVYSTFLGGSASDWGRGICVDASGSAYITGYTESADFPTHTAYDYSYNDSGDVFVTKLTPMGDALAYSTFLGAISDETGEDIDVDSLGNAYVTGQTRSDGFPTVKAYQTHLGYWYNAFVTEFNSAGNALVYSTCLGHPDYGNGIAVDRTGSAYLTGTTESSSLPTVNAYDSSFNGSTDAFVTKFRHVNLPPTARCRDAVRSADAYCQAAVAPAEVNNGSSDPEDGVNLTLALRPAGPFAKGGTLAWLIVTDMQGGTDSCPTTITVNDVTKPTVVCPSDVNSGNDPGQCGAVVNFLADASDNCPRAVLDATPPSGSFFPVGQTVVRVSVTDASGNRDTCRFTITVRDSERPTAVCPSGIIVPADHGQAGAVVTFNCSATDNCPGSTVACVPASGTFFPLGVTGCTCIATDAAGNADTCSFLVNVYIPCICPCHGDPQCDSVANVQDVVQTVNVAFRGSAPVFDPDCPRERTDVNCDGFSTVEDVVKMVDVAFRGSNPATEFCEPCGL